MGDEGGVFLGRRVHHGLVLPNKTLGNDLPASAVKGKQYLIDWSRPKMIASHTVGVVHCLLAFETWIAIITFLTRHQRVFENASNVREDSMGRGA